MLTLNFVLILVFHLNVDPDPGSQTNAYPDPGQIEFLHKNKLKVGNR